MRPLRMTVTIEVPPDGTPERDRFYSLTLAEILGVEVPTRGPAASPPTVRPFADGLDVDDEPADINRAELDAGGRDSARTGPPADGRELLGWIKSHGGPETQKRAVAIARSRGYGTMLVKLTGEQVADVYHELAVKVGPGRRRQKWGS